MPPDLEGNRRLVRHYFDLLNGSDLSELEEIISPDVVFFGPAPQKASTDGRRSSSSCSPCVASPPISVSPRARWSPRGTEWQACSLMTRTHSSEDGRAKVIATEGMDLFHIADGRIHQINAYLDRLSILIEMGLVSPPAQI